ncbi:MAG: hypothetical protein IKP24_03905 [Alphaproteobacteria bacterium]|nr:hypothetical protein [Alphaproteobacteria bacterium]
MQKVSYMGNGETTEFAFNFPYFENSNIVVTKNGAAATGYDIIGTSAGLDADIPYTGGTVVFEVAPTALDNITIARQLPLTRIVDYQPLAKIDPTTLNQDMNYTMEVLKDLQDELDGLMTQYAEIADKESTTTLLARIAAIHDEIVAIDAKITALGDVSQIRSDITDLNTRTNNLLDYVIESQLPTAENDYTWYRKYKSGWVEQGGYIMNGTGSYGKKLVNLIVEMANVYYYIDAGIRWGNESHWYTSNTAAGLAQVTDVSGPVTEVTTTSFKLQGFSSHCWMACGMAA